MLDVKQLRPVVHLKLDYDNHRLKNMTVVDKRVTVRIVQSGKLFETPIERLLLAARAAFEVGYLLRVVRVGSCHHFLAFLTALVPSVCNYLFPRCNFAL